MPNNIAIFAYNWSNPPYSKLDIYLDEFVKNFAELGFGVDVYIANEYVKSAGLFGISSKINVHKLDKRIASRNYKFILSVNNALLTREIKALKKQKVISLVVDDFNHLFNHDCAGLYDQFQYADEIVFSSNSHKKRLELNKGNLDVPIHFFPTATSLHTKPPTECTPPKKHNISLVANLLDTFDFGSLCQYCGDSPNRMLLLKRAVTAVREGNAISFEDCAGNDSLLDLLDEVKWTELFFEMQVQNLISNEARIAMTERLSIAGLALYGNDQWLAASAFYPKILGYFHSGKVISSHKDVMQIYNSSKICINVPQVQTGSALPYRVIDILASDALLVTEFHSESDLFAMFGKDCPVLMYRNVNDLVSICDHYLLHEDERLSLVQRCNALVEKGFSFKDRCLDLIAIVNLDCVSDSDSDKHCIGEINYINSSLFLTNYEKVRRACKKMKVGVRENVRRPAKRAVKQLIEKAMQVSVRNP